MRTSPNITEIMFRNGHRAKMIVSSAQDDPNQLLMSLGISKPSTLIMISGGASFLSDAHRQSMIRLFNDGVARSALENRALIIDGGTMAGVMSLMGLGVAHYDYRSILLGVAPAGCVMYPGMPLGNSKNDGVKAKIDPKLSHNGMAMLDPNHTHFVLVDSDNWGGETATMYRLATSMDTQERTVTILANGGLIAKKEILRTVRQNWPVIVLEGSGRLADEIAKGVKKPSAVVEDDQLNEILKNGDFNLFPVDGQPAQLRDLIEMHLQ